MEPSNNNSSFSTSDLGKDRLREFLFENSGNFLGHSQDETRKHSEERQGLDRPDFDLRENNDGSSSWRNDFLVEREVEVKETGEIKEGFGDEDESEEELNVASESSTSQPKQMAATRRARSRVWPQRSDLPYPVYLFLQQRRAEVGNDFKLLGRGGESGRNLMAIFQDTDNAPRLAFRIRLDPNRKQESKWPNYPSRRAVDLPVGLSLEELISQYPNHAWVDGLRIFNAEGWDGERMWNLFPTDARNDGASTRKWNYLQQALGREADLINKEERGKRRVPVKRPSKNRPPRNAVAARDVAATSESCSIAGTQLVPQHSSFENASPTAQSGSQTARMGAVRGVGGAGRLRAEHGSGRGSTEAAPHDFSSIDFFHGTCLPRTQIALSTPSHHSTVSRMAPMTRQPLGTGALANNSVDSNFPVTQVERKTFTMPFHGSAIPRPVDPGMSYQDDTSMLSFTDSHKSDWLPVYQHANQPTMPNIGNPPITYQNMLPTSWTPFQHNYPMLTMTMTPQSYGTAPVNHFTTELSQRVQPTMLMQSIQAPHHEPQQVSFGQHHSRWTSRVRNTLFDRQVQPMMTMGFSQAYSAIPLQQWPAPQAVRDTPVNYQTQHGFVNPREHHSPYAHQGEDHSTVADDGTAAQFNNQQPINQQTWHQVPFGTYTHPIEVPSSPLVSNNVPVHSSRFAEADDTLPVLHDQAFNDFERIENEETTAQRDQMAKEQLAESVARISGEQEISTAQHDDEQGVNAATPAPIISPSSSRPKRKRSDDSTSTSSSKRSKAEKTAEREAEKQRLLVERESKRPQMDPEEAARVRRIQQIESSIERGERVTESDLGLWIPSEQVSVLRGQFEGQVKGIESWSDQEIRHKWAYKKHIFKMSHSRWRQGEEEAKHEQRLQNRRDRNSKNG